MCPQSAADRSGDCTCDLLRLYRFRLATALGGNGILRFEPRINTAMSTVVCSRSKSGGFGQVGRRGVDTYDHSGIRTRVVHAAGKLPFL